ncbi:15-hydroxyprostaglandin dehydrogenase [NAD(+)] isoform X2 [Nematostella vectensis]|uniref:15-hydroxyprostaglandin dehydrogenase [NAD(+)] isoform X2 n=1 Tax=Nematostella vectensis TaxID=45351 RepID=UPI002077778F|nr:15-hydroxyprostaglandin dehydrogenase [NAD(+)] isoform X2 [Nematostella vectensis]XP_048576742.1 15-hydroxyprostaglandin dehydrogenase [NAD(+)] isoform X2 [Nematostella vectensis]
MGKDRPPSSSNHRLRCLHVDLFPVRTSDQVVLVDLQKKAGNDVTCLLQNKHGSGSVSFISCDVSNQDQLKDAFWETVSTHGHLDIVFNNAGILDEERWSKTLDVNLVRLYLHPTRGAVVHGTLLGIEHMSEGGVIINTSSTGGLHPASFCPVYCASKFGVVGFTRSIAPSALQKKGIRVNCVCPGSTDTKIFDAMVVDLSEKQKELRDNLPRQSPEEVAKAVISLIKDDTDNGQVVKVTYEHGPEYIDYQDVVV